MALPEEIASIADTPFRQRIDAGAVSAERSAAEWPPPGDARHRRDLGARKRHRRLKPLDDGQWSLADCPRRR